MNELLPEYPKQLVVQCVCYQTNQWAIANSPAAQKLCSRCERWQVYFNRQYDEIVAQKQPGDNRA